MMTIPRTDVAPDKRPELRKRADALMDAMIREFYEKVPFGAHMAKSDKVDSAYYKRHTIETILRLRMKRTCDAIAIQYFTKRDPVLAKKWAQYMDDEMLHDVEFFVHDLEKMGVSLEEIYATEPLLSTKLLMGYYQYGMEFDGTPLALIASVYFVEYTTTRTQVDWLNNISRSLGDVAVRGSRGHVELDLAEDHDDFVWDALMSLVPDEAAGERMLQHIAHVGELYVAYFIELYEHTVKQGERPISRLGESMSVLKSSLSAAQTA
jgi:hypothetical protein